MGVARLRTPGGRMWSRKLVAMLCAASVVMAACGRDSSSSDTTAAGVTTTAAADTTVAAPESTEAGTDTSSATGDTAAPTTAEATTTTAADPCAGVTLESTDIGVSADTITVLVMADV